MATSYKPNHTDNVVGATLIAALLGYVIAGLYLAIPAALAVLVLDQVLVRKFGRSQPRTQ
jgi:hypothetical protein